MDAIFAQTYKNIEVIFIDNNSTDKTALHIIDDDYKHQNNLNVIKNKDNLGYAGAANQGIKLAIEGDDKADYVVITNPDIIYSPTYFEKIVHRIDKDPRIACITGKVYKYDFENNRSTKIIDTVGLLAYKNRRIVDDGQGLIDEGQFDKEKEVFGISGACPLYRREALEDAKIMDEYLDDDFFMYKEDVDLSWRFNLLGWKNLYYPKALAFHGRGTGIFQRFTQRQLFQNRAKLSAFQKKYSFRNHLLMQIKNELPTNFIHNFFTIITFKIVSFFYISIFEPYLWKSYIGYLKLIPKMLKKRKLIMQKKRITSKQMQKFFVSKSSYIK